MFKGIFNCIFTDAMDEKSFEDRIAEMIKDKVSPTLAMDDEINLMWAEILIQVRPYTLCHEIIIIINIALRLILVLM